MPAAACFGSGESARLTATSRMLPERESAVADAGRGASAAEDGPEGLRGGGGGGREGGVGARGGGDDVPRGAGGRKLPQMAKLGRLPRGCQQCDTALLDRLKSLTTLRLDNCVTTRKWHRYF